MSTAPRLLTAALLLATTGCMADSTPPPAGAAAAGRPETAAAAPARDAPATVALADVPGWPAELAAAELAGFGSAESLLGDCLDQLNRPPRSGYYIFSGFATDDGAQFRAARHNPLQPRRGERMWCTYSATYQQMSIAPADVGDTGPGAPPFVARRRSELPTEAGLAVAELRALLPGSGPVIAWRREQ